jgi:hypothetical protein
MKRFVISVSILLFVSLGLMIVFAEAAVNPSRLVREPNQIVREPNQPTISEKVEPNKTPAAPEPNTVASILADPNKIEAEIKAFEGLERELDELDRKGADESRQWLQKEAGNKMALAKSSHENIMDELMFIRKLAVEEGAKKTTAAIEGLLLNRQQRFDKLNEKLQEQRKEERKELRRENVRSRPTDQRSSQDRRTRGR